MFDVLVALISAGLLAAAVWLFVFEPRSKVHDL
jgi:hypothetical protein